MAVFLTLLTGRRHQRPSSPMSTDSNMSPAITHKRPRRHKQNQSGQQGYQPKDVFNDGKDWIKTEIRHLLFFYLWMKLTFGSLCSTVFTDSCMPLSFPSQMSHGDYKVRGATLPRMGSGEARGRRGSTGTHRVKEGACEQRESQDKHKTSQGGKGSSKSRQHSGTTGRVIFHTFKEAIGWLTNCVCLSFRIWGHLTVQSSLFPIRSSSEGAWWY